MSKQNKPEKKLATVRTEDCIAAYMHTKKVLESAKLEFDTAKDELRDHLVDRYGYGVQLLSMVYNVCCWVRQVADTVTSSRSRHVDGYDKLMIRPHTKEESCMVSEAWEKIREKAKDRDCPNCSTCGVR